ncbi:MAG: tRNA pseudouridine(38-40) synthase TruA, partial [Nitrososphaerota archaeon]
MRRIRLDVAYDGTGWGGFQRQGRARGDTIQEALERALGHILDHPVRVWGAGRTDAGVHATGQVVAFDTTSPRSLETLVRGGNALLPPTIRILAARPVPPSFHPRFSALSRTYHYLILNHPRPDVLLRGRAWQVAQPLDAQAMRRAADGLLGVHDFSSYCSGVPARENRVRHLLEIDILSPPPLRAPEPLGITGAVWTLRLRANAWLRRMARLLTAALVAVGTGEWPPERPAQVLAARDNALAA